MLLSCSHSCLLASRQSLNSLVHSRRTPFVLAWPALVCISWPLLVVAVWVPHPYFCWSSFAPALACLHRPSSVLAWPVLAHALIHAHLPAALSFTSTYTSHSYTLHLLRSALDCLHMRPPGIDHGCCCCCHTHSQY